jgi:hypothetical protein
VTVTRASGLRLLGLGGISQFSHPQNHTLKPSPRRWMPPAIFPPPHPILPPTPFVIDDLVEYPRVFGLTALDNGPLRCFQRFSHLLASGRLKREKLERERRFSSGHSFFAGLFFFFLDCELILTLFYTLLFPFLSIFLRSAAGIHPSASDFLLSRVRIVANHFSIYPLLINHGSCSD